MARKKTGKHVARRPTGRSKLATMQRMEKEFKSTPQQLAAQISKEIKALKLSESKLKATYNKLKTKLKSSESKVKNANKHTPAGKKQLTAAKKLHGNNLKTQTILEKQLRENSNLLESAAGKQAKFTALKKHLIQFEKDWANDNQIKKNKTKTKVGARKKSRLKNTNTPQENYAPYQTETQRDYSDSFEEDVRSDETPEVTS